MTSWATSYSRLSDQLERSAVLVSAARIICYETAVTHFESGRMRTQAATSLSRCLSARAARERRGVQAVTSHGRSADHEAALRITQLEQALAERDAVWKAKTILVAATQCSADEA